MTHDTETDPQPGEKEQASLLPEAYPKIRVLPAEFARMLDVTRQSVSQWIKQGKVTLGADGRLDPQIATRQVLDNSDPGRLRAKVLRPLVNDADALRQQLAERDALIAALSEEANWLRRAAHYWRGFCWELATTADRFPSVVGEHWEALRQLEADPVVEEFRELLNNELLEEQMEIPVELRDWHQLGDDYQLSVPKRKSSEMGQTPKPTTEGEAP